MNAEKKRMLARQLPSLCGDAKFPDILPIEDITTVERLDDVQMKFGGLRRSLRQVNPSGPTDTEVIKAFNEVYANHKWTGGGGSSRGSDRLIWANFYGAFYAFSKLATLVAQSSTHAEIMALDWTVRLIEYCHDVPVFLGVPIHGPIPVFVDNKSAITLCQELKSTPTTSSINMRKNYIRTMFNQDIIAIYFVPTAVNVADLLTKPLGDPLFSTHRDHILHVFHGRDIISELTCTATASHITIIDASTDWGYDDHYYYFDGTDDTDFDA